VVKLFGILIALAGVCLGVYTGFWVMFVGGIIDIIDVFKAPTTDGGLVAIALLKIFGAGLVGGIIAWCGIILGATLGFTSNVRFYGRRRR
jgi:hypothetical protein